MLQFSAQKIKDQGHRVKILYKMTHISRQCLRVSPGTPGAVFSHVKASFQLMHKIST